MNSKSIKSKIKVIALLVFLSNGVMASGIPTVDIASITQAIQNAQAQASDALRQLQAARDQIAQAKSQYEQFRSVTEGNDKLGNFLNDPTLNSILPVNEWRDIYGQTKDLTSLRSKYGLTSSNSQVQAAFDKLLAQAGVLEDQYKATNERIKTAEGLRTQLNSVETPKDREQLALRYQQEQLELANQRAQLDNSRYLMAQQEKMASRKHAQDFMDYMNGKRPDLPSGN